jgi:Ca2+-binding RTX toxin-like protein
MSQDTGAVTVKAVEGNTITGTNADEVLIGGSGDDTLNGGSGKDYLIGGAGNDILNGGAGDDILAGGLGKDTLTGGADADTFVIDPSALTAGTQMADIITDYKIGEGDVVDLSELLGGNVTADNIGDFVRTVEGGNGAADQLQVNQSGSGNDADFVTVAHLNTDAGVKILYDDDLAAATVNHTP